MDQPGPSRSRRARVASWSLIAGAVANTAFLLEGYLGARLDRTVSFVSELGARGEPNADFFRLSDIVAGSLLLIGAIAAAGVLPRNLALRAGIASAAAVADFAARLRDEVSDLKKELRQLAQAGHLR